MAASMVVRLLGKGLSKTGKKESSEVAKKGTEVIGRRPEKDMGMVEEVQTKRVTGSKAEETTSRGGSGKAVAAGAAGAGVVTGVVLASGKSDKEDKGSSGKGRSFQEERPTRDAGRSSGVDESKASESKKASTFGSAFKEARSAGKDTFTYEGKKYTTELASEKKAAPKAEEKKATGVREGRNENIDDDTRKRAMASVAKLNKGGMVANKGIGASMKPHNVFGSKGKK